MIRQGAQLDTEAMSNLRPQLTPPRLNALPTKRAICTKHSIVIDRRRGNHHVASVGCMELFPAIFFAALVAAVVCISGSHLISGGHQ